MALSANQIEISFDFKSSNLAFQANFDKSWEAP